MVVGFHGRRRSSLKWSYLNAEVNSRVLHSISDSKNVEAKVTQVMSTT